MSKPILVTGATGNQGGAVLDSLVSLNSNDFTIIALTRNSNSSAASRIAAKSKSVRILQGNMDDPTSIFSDAQRLIEAPIWGVFMVQSVIVGGVTAAQEEAQGKKFIDACIANNVKTFVYSSVDRGGDIKSTQDPTPVSVFASKHRIEQHLFQKTNNTSMSWFVLRPTGLIEPAIRNDMVGKLGRTGWKVLMRPEKSIQWVSCKDVGYFATQGFLHPEQWSKKCLSLAGWEGSFTDANIMNKRVTGKDFSLTFGLLARFICNVVYKDLGVSYQWYDENGFGADIEYLRELHPGLLSLDDCMKEQAKVVSE